MIYINILRESIILLAGTITPKYHTLKFYINNPDNYDNVYPFVTKVHMVAKLTHVSNF